MWFKSQQPKTWTNGVDLYDVDDENRQHIERHSQQIEEGEANERRVHLISFRRTVVGSYDSTTKFRPFGFHQTFNQYSVL